VAAAGKEHHVSKLLLESRVALLRQPGSIECQACTHVEATQSVERTVLLEELGETGEHILIAVLPCDLLTSEGRSCIRRS